MSGEPPAPGPGATLAWPRREHVWLLAVAAVLLRLLLFLGRGDYLAFDEGWYLLLARSLYTGDGYSLIGVPHTALSPLFPILAGAVGVAIDSWVWGGRIVAALASGLLVLPAWAVFRRLAPPRTAFVAVALIAVLPPLAPFVAPYWIGGDLWVGAEPLLHLLLYTGIALWLKADEHGRVAPWALPGVAFGLAFLARPEAILTWGFLGLAALALAAWRRSWRRLAGAALMGLAFLVVAAPYWIYIHEVSGEWTLTGRGIRPAASAARLAGSGGAGGGGAAGTIERMLWEDDDAYAEYLYSLDPTGLRLRSGYWGIQPEIPATRASEGEPPPQAPAPTDARQDEEATGAPPATATPPAAGGRSPVGLFMRTLRIILPLLLWPFVILGIAQPRSRTILRRELPVSLALLGTSIAIAMAVAVDPRTQLFLVPMLAFYAARGFSLVEQEIQRRAEGTELRPGFVELGLAAIAVVWLLAINGERLYVSLAYGSPHHVVGAQNRAVAEELDALLGDDEGPIASWHPAIAVFADRDWRVLPHADLPRILRYEAVAGAEAIVLSAYYPPPLGIENLGTRYLIVPVPERTDPGQPFSIRVERGDSIRAVGVVRRPEG